MIRMRTENRRLLCLFQVWFLYMFLKRILFKRVYLENDSETYCERFLLVLRTQVTGISIIFLYETVSFLLRNLGHVSQYFTSEPGPQLLLPGPSALDTISMPNMSLPPHSHHATAGPPQLHPGLSPFTSNSSFGSSSRPSIDIAEKCIQSPRISLHASWNTLTQA